VSIAELSIVDLESWLRSDPGQYVQAWEQARVDALVADVFGYNALQVGLPSVNLLKANRMPFKAYAGIVMPETPMRQNWSGVVITEPELLAFESQSVDLLVLPHVLESARDPHQVLREVERVLVPEGRVVITGFNPWSLWGVRNRLPYMQRWLPQASEMLVSLPRLKDWLKLLSFDIDRGHFGCYVPALSSKKWLSRFAFMESAGDRWWPVCGGVYVVSAVKRVPGMRLMLPGWKTSKTRAHRRAAVAGAAVHHDSGASTAANCDQHSKS